MVFAEHPIQYNLAKLCCKLAIACIRLLLIHYKNSHFVFYTHVPKRESNLGNFIECVNLNTQALDHITAQLIFVRHKF